MRSIPACLRVRVLPLVLLITLVGVCNAVAQTSVFTYQGRLTEGTTPPSGAYEMQFKLFDALTGGTQQPQPTPVTIDLTVANGNAVTVGNGIFSVQLDFGANAFTGGPRYLEISVRHNSSEAFTVLSPRQRVTSTPYAIQSLNAATADGVSTAAGDSVVTAINAGSSTISGARLPSTLATQNGNNTFSGTNTFSSANTFSTSPTFSAGLSAGGQRVTGVGTPTAADDAATKAYVDANAGTPSGPAGGHLNLQHVALLRWYEANQAANFAVGTDPRGVAFDGANIWVTNAGSSTVSKL